MTDPFRPDDELVSAVLDGEATPDERARLESDPELSARLEELRAVSELVATPPPAATDAQREQAIAAAKAERQRQAQVRSLVDRRRRHEVPRFLASAAAVLVLLLGAGFLVSNLDVSGDDAGDDSAAGSAARTEAADEDGEVLTGAAGEEDALSESSDDSGGASGPQPSSSVIDELGQVADNAELYSVLRAASREVEQDADLETLDQERSSNLDDAEALPQAEGTSELCQVGLDEADPGLSGVLLQATAGYAGTPSVVYVYGTVTGRQRVVVVSEDGCQVLAVFDL